MALRAVAAGVSALAATGLCIEAVQLARADEVVTQADALLESAAWRSARPTLASWLGLRGRLQDAERLAPSNPNTAEALGVLHSRRAESRDFLTYAQDYFERAIELRPASPYTWANYAHVLYRLGETGPTFDRALANAAELGPWEPAVQRLVADVGLAMHADARPATRAMIESVVAAGMRSNPMDTLRIAIRHGRLDIACSHVAGNARVTDPALKKACEEGKKK